jgi:hypothetical protein
VLIPVTHQFRRVTQQIPLLGEEGWREAPGWSRAPQFVTNDHPVCADFGGFASLFPVAQPPLLVEEGNPTVRDENSLRIAHLAPAP